MSIPTVRRLAFTLITAGLASFVARAEPTSVGTVGASMGFTINMDKMHLIDPVTDNVL